MKIQFKYLAIFVVLLIIEIYIGVFVHDNIIRPFVGDALVVSVLYFFIRSFMKKLKFLPLGVFLFACIIEVGQYFNLVSILHLESFKLARIIIGATFDFKDIFSYLIGTILIYLYEFIEELNIKNIYNRNYK
ncbi:DUF2809 domain-containing protein [Clostridium sp. C2-6-12]|uniref:ribosomal maturation YjgA family protein n=1 Tax=Clostridium sp. C2-6-12 TaxID=2698832 RepID=UPI0013682265|nr:DUF2809 domain-containing protein [Clostridium sp. C2-6-12]